MQNAKRVTMTLSRDVTGRDAYIIRKALHVAAKTLLAQPFPEESDAEDMRAILAAVWRPIDQGMLGHDRVGDLMDMGLEFPSGAPIDHEAALTAWLAGRDEPKFILSAAIEEAAEMTAVLYRCSSERSVSDHDARERLHRANATIRVLSGWLQTAEAAAAIGT